MYKGSISYDAPMLYAMGFIGLFTIGGLTGLFLASLAVDVHVHDTYFIVAHFHYIMVGGMVMAYLGGIHFWWPKMTGRLYPEGWARFAALVIFIGFNLTFFPAVHPGLPRNAAAISRVSGGVSGAERHVDGGRIDSGRGIPGADGVSDLVAAIWKSSRRQSVEGNGPGVAHSLAAAD